MANHARSNRSVSDKRSALAADSVSDKRSALAGAQHNAYVHRDQVGGNVRREADGRWRQVTQEERAREEARERRRVRANEPMTPARFLRDNIVYILSVVAVAVIVLLLVFGVRAFSGPTPSAPSVESGEYQSPYDWSKLQNNNGHYAYVVDGKVKSRLGVDVADYQNAIDWDAVAADGIDFAIIRLGYRGATEGELYLDELFESNLAGAKAAGLDCGVYFFSQATTEDEAREEARFVLKHLAGVKLEYPVAFDSEVVTSLENARTAGLSDEQLSRIADAFCDIVDAAGYDTLVYGNAYDIRSYNVDALTGRDIWWAEYDAMSPSHYLDIRLWQYTSTGSVAGINSGADLNLDLAGVLN